MALLAIAGAAVLVATLLFVAGWVTVADTPLHSGAWRE